MAAPFRRRGLEAVVDTTAQAELDFVRLNVEIDRQMTIAKDLIDLPFSPIDRSEGHVGSGHLLGSKSVL